MRFGLFVATGDRAPCERTRAGMYHQIAGAGGYDPANEENREFAMTRADADVLLSDPELIPTRDDERLDTTRLAPWLRKRLEGAEGPLEVAQFGGGHANLTYLLRFGAHEYVLRRPPLGPVAPSAHDMRREFRVLSKLHRHFPLAPASYLYCDDEDLIGAPFQVMERRDGIVIRRRVPDLFDDSRLKTRIGHMVVDALSDLHRLDREAVGLGRLGRPEGFVDRQIDGWAKRWIAARHEDNPDMDRLIAWLRERRPPPGPVALIHNDYKLDNILVDGDDPARPVAILDWDMCTSGDPLADLGYLLNQWVEADDDPKWIEAASMPTAEPGFPRRADAIQRYAERTGFDVESIDWYFALATMKFAVVIQQIFVRYMRGQTRDERFARYDERAREGIAKACRVAGL